MGWIRSRRGFGDVTNSWSAEGIYAFDLTEDGKAALDAWNLSAGDEADYRDSNQKRGLDL